MPPAKSHAWLITNHAPTQIVSGYDSITGDIIAVDKGLEKVHLLRLSPALIIGDLDSLDPNILRLYPDVPLVRHQSEKNETDTELAITWCIRQNYQNIVICNDMQGRFDHSAAIVQNLIAAHKQGIDIRVESERQSFFFLNPETSISAQAGDLLSLISYSKESHFTGSTALKYPLTDLILHQHQSRGISNVLLAEQSEIQLKSGLVLAIVTKV
ncbi:MAG: thiamine diphosphokinase [Candidatus Cloacimonadaceae bacterium]|jgi:thiamine pyrophosphokinase|nr:thiamine diphosphokinase [Candidatus Cloacimonadota bacterium]MDY0128269.1 thiamine diphosphokinase [Candidatus Cloacimonadaceae bacterium]MCB5254016.1 thiamine diphosphokinase [Candidatus Cloacimonadota bacterium]MCK9178894.1 thiamine diphosphokinase [Candidatus Cloacimonadota bacterium]MCK9242992.1 thiamine diphosphokinase [Candidatus Cloacimonadota bacterium]